MEAASCWEQPPGSEDETEDPAMVAGLSLCGSAPLVWRMQDLRTLRSKGLVGALLGSLPRAPRQNGRLGRPLLLLLEEERLLREHQAAAALPQPDHSQAVSMSALLKVDLAIMTSVFWLPCRFGLGSDHIWKVTSAS